MIPSVNFHLWEPCNMRCKFCFATFKDVKQNILPKGHLPQQQAMEVVEQLADIGFEKITFAGGEPLLCKWIPNLIATAKERKLTTMLVTNGSQLSDEFLEVNKHSLDWIAISIDSLNPITNMQTGRAIAGNKPLLVEDYKAIIDKVKDYGYGLKINTVVSASNMNEDMTELINYAKPARWKIFQVLPIKGQNDANISDFEITDEQFHHFLERHQHLNQVTKIVAENNHHMKGSYAMVDPAGRFYDNAKGTHNYSKPILEVGARIAIQQVNYDFQKFVVRGGIYEWQRNPQRPTRITLSGEVASGKSSVGKLLAKHLNYEFISLGNKVREIANDEGLSIVEFQQRCELNPTKDKDIDRLFAAECNTRDNLIIDYRLGYKFITHSFNVFLKVKEDEAERRLKQTARLNETHATVKERNRVTKQQFINAYNEHYTNPKNYDLVVDTSQFDSQEDIVLYILNSIKQSECDAN